MKKVSKEAESKRYYERRAALHRAFAHPARIHVVDILARGQAATADLLEKLHVSPANLSQHLSVLRSVGVVKTRREGKQLVCELSCREVVEACNQMRNILTHRLSLFQRFTR